MVPTGGDYTLCTLSKKLSIDEKSRLAANMLNLEEKKLLHWDKDLEPGHMTYQLGKPILELDLTPQTSLFALLGTNFSSSLGYPRLGLAVAKAISGGVGKVTSLPRDVCTVKVTNDCAECDVKVKT